MNKIAIKYIYNFLFIILSFLFETIKINKKFTHFINLY